MLFDYELKWAVFHELMDRALMSAAPLKLTVEEKSVVSFFRRNQTRSQAAVHCFPRQYQFARAKRSMIKFQANFRRLQLVYSDVYYEDRETRGIVFEIFKARLRLKHERRQLRLISGLFECVREYFVLQSSGCNARLLVQGEKIKRSKKR
jgi:hypothetical protein